jgi:hypothetical protein
MFLQRDDAAWEPSTFSRLPPVAAPLHIPHMKATMRKLRIEIDALQVDTFEVLSSSAKLRGTVNGAAPDPDYDDTTGWGTGGGSGAGSADLACITAYPCVPTNEASCQYSCLGTCRETCPATCARTCGSTCYAPAGCV